MTIAVVPCDEVEDIDEMPAMVESWRSIGPATEAAIVSALAPGSVAVTAMVGKSTFGSAETGSRRKPNTPNAMIEAVSSVVMTGRRIQSSESVIDQAPALGARAAIGVPSDNSNWPSVTTSSPPASPVAMTDIPRKVRLTLTGCTWAFPSFMTNT